MARFDTMQAGALDGCFTISKGGLMTRIIPLLALAAAVALAGCNRENHTIVAGPNVGDNETNAAANAPVTLPPAITASKIYRCADNQVVYVDWLSDNKSANVRIQQNGAPTQLTAPEAGKPMSAAGGYSLDGSASAASVKIGVPGHPAQSCKA
jgi:hypothetical protein